MQRKIDRLKSAAASGNGAEALRIAARFPRLGEHGPIIIRAHEALHSAAFYRQLGRDPEALVAAGIEALKERYRLP